MGIIRHIPNTITLLNLLCGTIASIFALNGQYHSAFIMIITAAIFDFFDGMSARLLKAYSPLGKELDSLADLISFGLAPTFIVYDYLSTAYSSYMLQANIAGECTIGYSLMLTLPFALIVCSALRLANFNIDENQKENFIGLATPSAALLISGFVASIDCFPNITNYFIAHAWILSVSTLIIALLLVSKIPMFSFKFKSFSWKGNELKYFFIIFAIVIAIALLIAGLFMLSIWFFIIILFYIIANIIIALIPKK